MMRFSSNITSDPASSKIVDQVILLTQDYLTDFALNENFSKQVELAFGDRFDPTKLEELRQQWVSGQFEVWPKIETRPAAEINGAIGAFSADTNTVTLSQEYIAQNLLNLQEINTTVLEEIGHFVDSRINTLDVSGDEGEFFSALVRGVEFNEGEIYRLKSEDDRASITLNGQVFQVEQAAADIKRPILIIPGIGGTFGKDFNTRWYFNRGVKPEELEVDPIGGVYYDLIKTLKNVGYIEGENLFIANYDWRLPTGPLDSQIDGNIDGLSIASITDNIYEYGVDYLGYWLNQAKAKGASEVDIIAHSTGGLITRTYIQSDAYKLAGKQAGLPKINNFFMIGVPNRGASQAWNPLRDNWIRKADSKSGFLGIGETGPDRLVLSKIIKKAYQHVLEGGIITGLPSSISLETIKDSVTNKPDPVKFVNQYVPTLRNLLATYKFLEIVDEFPLGVFDVNNNPNERNSLLLDLNDGFDLSSISKPNSFADKSHPIAIYGTSELTETTVTKITGNRFGGNEFSDVILPFTDFLARDPEPKEVWYRSNAFERNGDGTVPLESSIGLFTNDSRIERKHFTKGDNTKEDVTHLGLMYNTDVQKLILDTLQISFEESNISKGSNFSTFDSLLVALFDINILGIGPFVPLNIHDSINSLENTSFDLSTKSLNFANFQNSANVLAADNLANFLSQLPDLLNEKLSTINLPLLGDSLKSLNFIDQLGLQDIADIKIDDKSNPDEVKVTLKLYKDISQFSLPIATDFGLPSLGLEVDGNTQLDVGLNFTLSFGVNKNTGFSIDTSSPNEFSIDLKASIPDLTAIGKMGFLQLKVSDEDADDIAGNGDKDVDGDGVKATNLVASLAVDILGDLNSGFSINKPELKGSANINLRLESSFDGSAKLPKIDTDLALNWDDLSKATPDEFKFNNITLNTGSFFTGFASPILDKIQTVTEPVQPIIKVLTTPIDLKVAKADLLDVGRKLGQIDESDENSIRSLQQLNSLADSIKNGGNVSLKLGSVDLTDKGDITQPDFSSKLTLDEQPVDVVAELEKVKAAAKTELEKAEADKAKTLVSSFKSVPGAGLEFPILTDPTTVVNLLLGKDVNLFAYDLPQLGFDFNYEQFFPVIGPLGVRLAGNVGANVDLNFGYDTVGLKQFIQSQDVDDIFNGFFVSDRKPPTGSGEDLKEATLNAGIKASASVEGGIVRGDAGGKIDGLLGLDLNDPSHPDDGKVRVNEINELLGCPFDVSGKLSAGLFARLQVGFGPFKYTKHFNFVNKTLLSFEAGCDAAVSHKPNKDNFGLAEDLGSGILHLNMGPRASKRRTSGQSGKDEDEVFAIQTGANTAAINVSAFSITEPYQGVVQIVADGGQEDDTIQIGEGVAIATSSKGGSGNDQLYGGSGNDTLKGEAGDDALFGGKGDDDLLGGDGDDYLEGGAGADTLDGGSNSDNTKGGGDTVSYKDSPVDVRFNVDPSDSSFFIGSGGDAQGDKLRNIEHIEGSNFDDRLLGDKSSNTLEGLRGNDTLEGGGGDDILLGGIGADRLDGGSGRDWTGYVASSAEVKINLETGKASSGDAEGDTLISIEDIKGSIHNDVLIGSRFNNYLDGFLGDDRIIGSSGADTLDGGEGRDWVSYETSADGVNVSLRTGQGQDGDAQGDELVKVKDDKGNRHSLQLV
jgi:Ca2+-binding RTX toxin-like protein